VNVSGKSALQAMEAATLIASVSVQSPGTQTSFPNRDGLPQDLFL
jgi:hypothetical protein